MLPLIEPDFGSDITAVDTTTLGDDDVQPFYPKDMEHIVVLM